jgi:hypothetical protein
MTFGRATKKNNSQTFRSKLKVWSTFSKVVGVGNAHKLIKINLFSFKANSGSCSIV